MKDQAKRSELKVKAVWLYLVVLLADFRRSLFVFEAQIQHTDSLKDSWRSHSWGKKKDRGYLSSPAAPSSVCNKKSEKGVLSASQIVVSN